MRWTFLLCLLLLSCKTIYGLRTEKDGISFFSSKDTAFRYVGRFDNSQELPRCWAPGTYIEVGFAGSFCEIEVNDEVRYGTHHNYIEVIIDNLPPQRIRLKAEHNVLVVASDLKPGKHTLVICKNTEAAIGFIEFVGVSCKTVYPIEARKKKIEFIGDSITCGNGCDDSQTICGEGQWFDQHNAYLSYGPSIARQLDADWQICAVSGIGLTRSCCGSKSVMPQIYDRVNLCEEGPIWQSKENEPDIVVITLGQNDGLQDSTVFCASYVEFIRHIRKRYLTAEIICCASPMANEELKPVMKNYVEAVAGRMAQLGDARVCSFAYTGMYRSGCTSHPTAYEHTEIAGELGPFLRRKMSW
jgi:lysophospholipase L1-like esterase